MASLTSLNIYKCLLETISESSLYGLQKMRWQLDLLNNKITERITEINEKAKKEKSK